ncbi:MAG TPA: aminotransferase class V-fold PLP-dependent enzyme [Acetobacteraceae bacterium]|jgi:isopenicillin-N epimerase|nr:aminotransferase class V-fold PLP-dependent enzyme [Acetobacteraceae bacterium]
MSWTNAPSLLGRAVRHEWPLDWGWLTVNHGSFGATPRVVLATQQDWRRELEAQPTRFMHETLPAGLAAAAARLGAFLGADGKDIGFLDNATAGCNTVLRSLRLASDDEVLVLSHGYGAVRNTVRFVTERAGARMTEAAIPFPRPDAEAIVASVAAALTERTRIAVIDHITSGSALVLPLAEIIAACHAADLPVLVDGAHGPGQVTLDLGSLGADWYVGSCHKWLCAPKGSAFLWAAPDRQAELHPLTISHGFGQGFRAEFDWTGTRDASACLAIPTAIDFHHRLGDTALRARNVTMAAEGARLLADRLGTEVGTTCTLAGAMGVVRVPVAAPATAEWAQRLRQKLLAARTDAPVHALDGAIWLRISAHAYNEIADYEALATIVSDLV